MFTHVDKYAFGLGPDQRITSGPAAMRAFKRSTGVPPYRWLTKLRIERAKELLKDPRCELADIAQLCGFVDQSHFTRVFSRSEGWRRFHHL